MEASAHDIKRFGAHRNAFGFLRLLFASLVIVAHTPELADGDTHRELLTRMFGTLTFGGPAVDGFFTISGYLIVGSFLKQPQPRSYLRKRVLRIYPAFIVAWLLCLLVVAPLGGAALEDITSRTGEVIRQIATLQLPVASGVFAGTPYPDLNGAMWTIAYEFRCYMLVLAFGLMGVFRKPWLVASSSAVLLIGHAVVPFDVSARIGSALPLWWLWLGVPHQAMRLGGVFLAGAMFYLWRDRIGFTLAGAAVAAAGLFVCMFFAPLADAGLATFGAYLIFAVARWGGARNGLLARINNRNDISYGVYLYAWPVEKLLLWYWPGMSLLSAGLLTFALACLCGWLSWHLLEKPIMRYSGRPALPAGPRLSSPAGAYDAT